MSFISPICRARIVTAVRSVKPTVRLLHQDSHNALSRFTPLQTLAPSFTMNGSNITPMTEPSQFYTNLKDHILSAKERIFIAALYIGSSEKELVDTIHTALSKSNSLKVHILIDCLRGTRASKQQSSATLLLPLVEKYPDQVQISLYHTPDLTGLLKKALPQRFNESIGLMHLKVYGFDDSVMLSGANLSTDYFTNRQDRYIKFGDTKDLSDYYCDLLETVGSFSYKLRPPVKIDGAVAPYSLLLENTADPVHKTLEFKSQAYKRMQNFLKKYSSNNENKAPSGGSEHDTVVYPVIQMAPLGIRQDENTTLRILDIIHEHGKSVETDAYWKLLPRPTDFFNSKGVSKYLPPAYTLIERQFHREVKRRKRESSITIKEFERPDWTYHAKGLWLYLQGEKYPAMTMIGSPNFGYRSNERDLEAQAVVVTENAGLRKAIHQELELLRNYCEPVTDETFQRKERYVPYGVRIATSLFGLCSEPVPY